VVRDGKAESIELTEGGTYRNAWIVTAGVEPGDNLIVDGLKSLRAGAEVNAVPVTIDETGLVQDAAEDAAPAQD
jgi:membrane fusion protein (multidrug efflux system)